MEDEKFYLGDELDKEILKHRDCHFGGHFPTMIDYYEQEGIGINDEISIDRIRYLAEIEEKMGYNLAAELLSGAEMEEVARSRQAYKQLRSVYDDENLLPKLIADLILADKEHPQEEINALVRQGRSTIKPLKDLLISDVFYSPLFPGYGLAPGRAALCLGLLKDKDSIIPLFESLSRGNFLNDEPILTALSKLKPDSLDFLTKLLQSRPITEDNERAAMVLASIAGDDHDIAKIALKELIDLDIKRYSRIAAYLIPLCYPLNDPDERIHFKELLKKTPDFLKDEIELILKLWKK